MIRVRFLLAALIAAAIAVPAMRAAQQPALPGPAVDPDIKFEVVSIKRADQSSGQNMMRVMPGGFTATSVTAGELLRQMIFRGRALIGLPDWTDSDRYAIVAKSPSNSPNANSAMLLNLLKDRFRLAMHMEARDMPIYDLVMARPDSGLGPGLKRTSRECQEQATVRIGGASGAQAGAPPGAGAPSPTPSGDLNRPACGQSGMGPGIAGAGGVPITILVQMLSQLTGRRVVDKTGLAGLYDLTLRYAPESALGAGGVPPGAAPSATDPNAPNLFTALQEQLGLKLDSQRGPVEVIVIDRIERPTPN